MTGPNACAEARRQRLRSGLENMKGLSQTIEFRAG
jgi:hypothetical protein